MGSEFKGIQSVILRRTGQQVHKAADHITSAVRKQTGMILVLCSLSFTRIPSPRDGAIHIQGGSPLLS